MCHSLLFLFSFSNCLTYKENNCCFYDFNQDSNLHNNSNKFPQTNESKHFYRTLTFIQYTFKSTKMKNYVRLYFEHPSHLLFLQDKVMQQPTLLSMGQHPWLGPPWEQHSWASTGSQGCSASCHHPVPMLQGVADTSLCPKGTPAGLAQCGSGTGF